MTDLWATRHAVGLLTSAVVVSAIGGTLLEQQQDIFRTGVTMVPIDVRAFDRQGCAVTNLKAEDFTIYEDGIPQTIAHFSTRDLTRETPATCAAVSVPAAPATSDAAQPRGIPPQTSRGTRRREGRCIRLRGRPRRQPGPESPLTRAIRSGGMHVP